MLSWASAGIAARPPHAIGCVPFTMPCAVHDVDPTLRRVLMPYRSVPYCAWPCLALQAQQHSFNMPYQLSHPKCVSNPDSADDADVQIVDVEVGWAGLGRPWECCGRMAVMAVMVRVPLPLPFHALL